MVGQEHCHPNSIPLVCWDRDSGLARIHAFDVERFQDQAVYEAGLHCEWNKLFKPEDSERGAQVRHAENMGTEKRCSRK